MPTKVKQSSIWDQIWKDRKGRVVIWQMPNVWLWSWLAVTGLSLLFTGPLADILYWAGAVALAIWSYLEITTGVNYFRRALGVVIGIFTIMSVIHVIT